MAPTPTARELLLSLFVENVWSVAIGMLVGLGLLVVVSFVVPAQEAGSVSHACVCAPEAP